MIHGFLVLSQGLGIYLSSRFLLISVVSQSNKVSKSAGSLFCWLSLGLVVWPKLGDLFVHSSKDVENCLEEKKKLLCYLWSFFEREMNL